jgi:hypothetical protein
MCRQRVLNTPPLLLEKVQMTKIISGGECQVCQSLKNFSKRQANEDHFIFIPFRNDAENTIIPDLTQTDLS